MARYSYSSPSLEELYAQEDIRKTARNRGLLNTAVQQIQPNNMDSQRSQSLQLPDTLSTPQLPQISSDSGSDLNALFAGMPARADTYNEDQANQIVDAIQSNKFNVDQAGQFYGVDPSVVQANYDAILANRAKAAAAATTTSTNATGTAVPAVTPTPPTPTASVSVDDQLVDAVPIPGITVVDNNQVGTGLIGSMNNQLNIGPTQAPAGSQSAAVNGQFYKGSKDPFTGSTLRNEDKTQINSLYQSILGRDGDKAGLDKYLNDMDAGASIDAVRSGILKTDEYKGIATTAIQEMYQTILGRAADPQSLNFYVSTAQEGTSLEDIRIQIQNSAEAQVTRAQNASGPITPTAPTPVDAGSQATASVAEEEAATYTPTVAAASADAGAEDAVTPSRTVSEEETVQYQLGQIIDPNSELMKSARTRGLQYANQRGLLNSSIAAQAAEQAVLDAAIPIAQQDARTYADAAGQVTDFEGRGALQDAQLGTNVSMFNVGEDNVTNRFNAESQNRAGEFNANAANVAIQNFLQREAARDLQDDAQLFTADQNEADRNLRNYLQERQFNFQSAENILDRDFQNTLQENQQSFRAEESSLDRELSQLQADQRITFETWSQENNQTWNEAQNQLQREFDKYRTDSQMASTILYSTMENIAEIQADPNLNKAQKQAAISNVMNMTNSMPALFARIDAGMTQQRETTNPDNYDDDGLWIGDGLPTWVTAPADDATVTQAVETLTNPDTGQTFDAPTGGYTLNILNANQPANNDQTGLLQTPVDPSGLTPLPDANGVFTDGDKFYRYNNAGDLIEIDDPSDTDDD